MKLCYSVKGHPYIEMKNGNKFIFSTITEDNAKGFKWLVFSGGYSTSIPLSGSKKKNGKEPKVAKMFTPVSFVTDMKLTGIPKSAKRSLSGSSVTSMKRILNDFVEDGYFCRENLPKLEKLLNGDIFIPEDYVEEDPMGYDLDDEDDE